jgi:phosphohistidine phosphatase
MEIYLMRHAEAISQGDWRGSDAVRPLNEKGAERLKEALKEMARVNFAAEVLLTSPFVRATQTASFIHEQFPNLTPVVSAELISGMRTEQLRTLLLKHKDKSSVWIVGHMPDLAVVASRILLDPMLLDRNMAPGEILALKVDSPEDMWGKGTLLWFRTLEDWKSQCPTP